MIIDCDICEMRDIACDDCVMTALLGGPPNQVEFDDGECVALDVLAGSGLVPPLRLVVPLDSWHGPGRPGGAGRSAAAG